MSGVAPTATATEQALAEDLARVDAGKQGLRTVIVAASPAEDGGHTVYTLRTTDRHGNQWETLTRYSEVAEFRATLTQGDMGTYRNKARFCLLISMPLTACLCGPADTATDASEASLPLQHPGSDAGAGRGPQRLPGGAGA